MNLQAQGLQHLITLSFRTLMKFFAYLEAYIIIYSSILSFLDRQAINRILNLQ